MGKARDLGHPPSRIARRRWRGGIVYSRPLPYRNRKVPLPDTTQHSFLTGEIDVGIALDVMALANRREYDVALVFS